MTIQLLVGPTRTYTTITAALNTIPFSLSDVYEVIVDAGTYNESVDLGTHIASSSTYIHLKAALGDEHNFNLSAGVIINSSGVTSRATLNARANFNRVTNIIAICNAGINFGLVATGNSALLTNVVAIVPSGAGSTSAFATSSTTTMICCFALNRQLGNGAFSFALGDNNTLYNCGDFGFTNSYFLFSSSVNGLFRNCYSTGSVGWTLGNGASYSASCSNNAGFDSTAPGSSSLTNKTLNSYAFINTPGNNYHILNTSVLFNTAVNLSSIFSRDIDNLPIVAWCIGPDSATPDPYQPTPTKPSQQTQSNPTSEPEAQAPTLNLQGPSSAANFANSLGQNKEASVPGLNTSGNTGPVSIADIQAQKGYKNGFVSIMPEYGGYGAAGSVGTGNMVYLVEDRLITGKKFKDKAQITPSRAFNERATMAIDPQGQFTHEFRSNDSIALLQSHFQNRIGTTPATGTTYYEFTPHRAGLTLQGSTFGTGSYSAFNVSNAFTVSVYKALRGTGYHYKSGICNSLKFSFDPSDTVNVESDFRFATFSIIGTNGIPTGAYSGLSSFPGHKCNINFMGLPLLGFDFTCTNNLSKFSPVGTKTNFYKFGAYTVSGNADIDLPNDALRYIGSMIGGSVFSIDGTMLNDARDMVVFQMPTCVLDPFEIGVGMNLAKLSFKAYESEDASTPAITFKVWTQNYSATTFEPN